LNIDSPALEVRKQMNWLRTAQAARISVMCLDFEPDRTLEHPREDPDLPSKVVIGTTQYFIKSSQVVDANKSF
jgi:hypothetical protein